MYSLLVRLMFLLITTSQEIYNENALQPTDYVV